jgi:FAD/FMN-containing dehydrogenase
MGGLMRPATAYGSWCWLDAAADAVNIQWARKLSEVMRLFTTGSDYVNQIAFKAGLWANYDRLVGLKSKYDPTNLFRHNQNIKPTV